MCPNCHEELFIYETQNEYLPDIISNEFISKVNDQKAIINEKSKTLVYIDKQRLRNSKL